MPAIDCASAVRRIIRVFRPAMVDGLPKLNPQPLGRNSGTKRDGVCNPVAYVLCLTVC